MEGSGRGTLQCSDWVNTWMVILLTTAYFPLKEGHATKNLRFSPAGRKSSKVPLFVFL
jgi:hypothetical protein